MAAQIKGGFNIAMKVPSHQYQATLAFYRDVIGLKPFDEKAPAKGFELGPNRLWIDEAPMLSQAEVWLELFTDNSAEASGAPGQGGRCPLRRDRAARGRFSRRLDHEPRQHRPHGARAGRMVSGPGGLASGKETEMHTTAAPFLMFEGKAEEAFNFYVSVLPDSHIISIDRYGPGQPGPKAR